MTENNYNVKNRVIEKVARKTAFSKYVSSKKVKDDALNTDQWKCCGEMYLCQKDIHKHISLTHMNEILVLKKKIIDFGDEDASYMPLRKKFKMNPSVSSQSKLCGADEGDSYLPNVFSGDDEFPWLPVVLCDEKNSEAGQILLFYHYKSIENVEHVCLWQQELCHRLHLTGKVRVSSEGLNATVGGSVCATKKYIAAVLQHPLFCDMNREQFKISPGSTEDFPEGLKVGIFKEAVPMGVDPNSISFKDAGKHLTAEEFHIAAEKAQLADTEHTDSVFIDCRNFYESKIGRFSQAVCPDIRKFSYWPEYVDKNPELFQDKKVYMYCTGGIRCERGSAYLKSKGLCKEVFQLEGGIHKYIEKYPEGFFRGKLFVFDNRFHIKANDDVISVCTYCAEPWDCYQPCTSPHCHQLVLSCDHCRSKNLTACCQSCQDIANKLDSKKEECECTRRRARVPVETGSKQSQ